VGRSASLYDVSCKMLIIDVGKTYGARIRF